MVRRPVVRIGGVARPPAAPLRLAPFPVPESVAVPANLCPRTDAFGTGDSSILVLMKGTAVRGEIRHDARKHTGGHPQ